MASSRAVLLRLVRELENQGCTIRQGKGPTLIVKTPNGKAIPIHMSPSDYRSMKNLRGDIRRAGLIWPKGLTNL